MEIETIVKKAQELQKVRDDQERLKSESKELDKQERELSREILPELLLEAGVNSFKTDEFEIKTSVKYEGSIRKSQDQQQAIDLLVRHGMGAIVNKQIVLSDNLNSAGGSPVINAAVEILNGSGLPYEVRCDVHPMTLKKAIRELLESGIVTQT
jgi:hypothetical protein